MKLTSAARIDVIPVVTEFILPILAVECPEEVFVVSFEDVVNLLFEFFECAGVLFFEFDACSVFFGGFDFDVECAVGEVSQFFLESFEALFTFFTDFGDGECFDADDFLFHGFGEGRAGDFGIGVDAFDFFIEHVDVSETASEVAILDSSVEDLLERGIVGVFVGVPDLIQEVIDFFGLEESLDKFIDLRLEGFVCGLIIGEDIDEIQENLASVGRNDLDFNLNLLPEQIQAESVSEPDRDNNYNFKYRYDMLKANANNNLIQKIAYQMTNTRFLSFFSNDPSMYNLLDVIDEFLHTPDVSLYIDTSELGAAEGIGGMVIDLISSFVIGEDDIYPFVFFIDEVHRYAKSKYSEKEFHGGLTLLAREGRKKGIFLYLTTQNPKDVPPILFGQIGTLLIHRLMLNDEIRAVESHLDDYAIKHVRKLNQGEVILSSVNLLHNMFIHVDKCDRIQHNMTPKL